MPAKSIEIKDVDQETRYCDRYDLDSEAQFLRLTPKELKEIPGAGKGTVQAAEKVVVQNYSELVESGGMNNRVFASTEEDLMALSADQVLGCIAWHFRRDHFDNGSLIHSSITEGHMLRMLKVHNKKMG